MHIDSLDETGWADADSHVGDNHAEQKSDVTTESGSSPHNAAYSSGCGWRA